MRSAQAAQPLANVPVLTADELRKLVPPQGTAIVTGGNRGIGFGADVRRSERNGDSGRFLADVLPEDLLKFGLIPEFVGRLPVITNVHNLDKTALIEILTKPKNALVRQYRRFFEFDGVELEFSEDALEAVAEQAILRGTGARGLRAILEEVLLNTMYELPSSLLSENPIHRYLVNSPMLPLNQWKLDRLLKFRSDRQTLISSQKGGHHVRLSCKARHLHADRDYRRR